jgi:hypothetical protein
MFALLLALSADPPTIRPAHIPKAPVSVSARQVWLDAHNAERARLGQKPLVWSERLEKDAASWAATMARNGNFEHAPPGKEDQGENLWMGTKGAFPPGIMVQAWIDERQHYVRGIFPKVSRTGQWADVGHYTQIIWHETREVGCAQAASADSDYLVCRYLPAGNVMGQDAQGQSGLSRRTRMKRRS